MEMKSGIFLDVDNLVLNGGWGMRFNAIRKLVEAQGARVLRANAYMAVESERERSDRLFRKKKMEYREKVREAGFRIILREAQKFQDEDGQWMAKPGADLDIAVDALSQSANLDHVVLGTSDVDFVRLVRALQSKGKRVDLIGFSEVSGQLRREVDYFFSGYTFPDVLPIEKEGRRRGIMHFVNEERGFGFVTMQVGLHYDDRVNDVFLHLSEVTFDGDRLTDSEFIRLRTQQKVIEFDLQEDDEGRRATNATVIL